MTFALTILAVLVLYFLAGAVPVSGGNQVALFRSPAFLLASALLAGSLIHCCWRHRRGLRGLIFIVTHLSVVLVLVGAALGLFAGKRAHMRLFKDADYVVDRFLLTNGEEFEPGFGLALADYEVDYYDPDYDRFLPPGEAGDEYTYDQRYPVTTAGTVRVPGVGESEPLHSLTADGTDEWRRQCVMPDGSMLQVAPRTVRHYHANLRIHREATSEAAELEVNRPVTVDGWRIYLMSEDRDGGQFIVVTARRDPGRGCVIAGIWLLILGTAGTGFRRTACRRGATDA